MTILTCSLHRRTMAWMSRKPAALNVAEAKRDFSSLLARVAFGGESVTITRRGRPMARLVPIAPETDLADVKGWLDDDDPFFASLEERERKRTAQPARVLSRSRAKR